MRKHTILCPNRFWKKKVAPLGVFLALALVCSYVESLIPFYFGAPGIKLGLANIMVLLALYLMGPGEAFVLSVLRVLLVGILFGNAYSLLYSLAGAMLSFGAMWLLQRGKKLHMISVSMAGGICHNLGQVAVAALLVENYRILFYFVVLYFAGMLTGALVGVVAWEVYRRTKPLFLGRTA